MAAPKVTINNVSSNKISQKNGHDISEVVFTFDQPVTEWTINVLGTSSSTGSVAHYDARTVDWMMRYSVDEMLDFTVDEAKQFDTGVELTGEIDWTELYQEGSNRVNIYGKNSNSEWTPYEG